jgi:Dyp-type peroxidase family
MQNLFTRSHPPIYVTAEYRSSVGEDALSVKEIELMRERIKQPGVAFPSAAKQHHLFIIRLDLKSSVVGQANRVLNGLRRLCSFIDRIDEGEIKVDEKLRDGTSFQYPLSRYNFTVTIGFGASFFDKLQVSEAKRPKMFHVMPDHFALGDPLPYTLKQTDMLLQLGSTSDFVNRWVFQNDSYHRIFRNIGYDIRDQFIGHLQQTGEDDLDVMNCT